VGRAHGLDGSFYVTRPRPRVLRVGATLAIDGVQRRITRLAGTEGRPLVRVAGVDTRAEADALRGCELTVEEGELPVLEAEEWWAHELEGCAVFDGEEPLGTVVRLLELPSCEALEVGREGGSFLVPMVKDAIRSVSPAERRIDVDGAFLDLPTTQPRTRGKGRGGAR